MYRRRRPIRWDERPSAPCDASLTRTKDWQELVGMVGNQKVACAPSACLERKRGNDVDSLQKAKRKGRWRDAVAGLMRRGCRPEKGTRAHGVPWKSFFSYLLICLVLDDKCWYTLALIDLYTVFCSETIPQFTVEVEPEVRKRSRYACITT